MISVAAINRLAQTEGCGSVDVGCDSGDVTHVFATTGVGLRCRKCLRNLLGAWDAMRPSQDGAKSLGRKGGQARAKALTPEQRSEIATKASHAAAAARTARRATPPPPTDSPSGGHDSGPSNLST